MAPPAPRPRHPLPDRGGTGGLGGVVRRPRPGVGSEFHAGTSQLSSFGATLSLGAAIALPLAALADRWRRGPVAAIGIVAFTLASLGRDLTKSLPEPAAARWVGG